MTLLYGQTVVQERNLLAVKDFVTTVLLIFQHDRLTRQKFICDQYERNGLVSVGGCFKITVIILN